jgi:hypothetical protein
MIPSLRRAIDAVRDWTAWRRRVRACPHPPERVHGQLVDFGCRKIWICDGCDSVVPDSRRR